jgi:hypothetical protein
MTDAMEVTEGRARVLRSGNPQWVMVGLSWPEREGWTLAHRLLVYRTEQRLQAKADEIGKPIIFACMSGIRMDWLETTPPTPVEFHQHTVQPRGENDRRR